MKKASKTTISILYIIAFIFTLYIGLENRLVTFTFSAIFTIALIAIANLEAIKSLIISEKGIQLETTIKEAKSTIHELKLLASNFSKVHISTLVHSNMWRGFTNKELETYANKFSSIMDEMKIPPKEQQEAFQDLYFYNKNQYIKKLTNPISCSSSSVRDNPDGHQRIEEIQRKKFREDIPPEEIEKLLKSIKESSKDKKEILEDYKYYYKEFKHRRPEVFYSFSKEE